MKQIVLLNPDGVSEEEVKSYRVREAARAVAVDGDGKIALLHVSKDGYYKLPGGGVESGEDRQQTLRRECREETGCDIQIIGEVGSIVEYRRTQRLKQISYCFFAHVKGEKGDPQFTDEEVERGFELKWLSYEEATRMMAESSTIDDEGRVYIVPRDILFLKSAKDLIGN